MAAFLVSAAILGVPAITAYASRKRSQQAGGSASTPQEHVAELSGTVSGTGDSSLPSSGVPLSGIPAFEPMYSHESSAVHAVLLSTDHPQAVHLLRRSGMAVHHVKVSAVKKTRPTPSVVIGRIPSQQAFDKIAALPFFHSAYKQVSPAPVKPASIFGASSLPNPVTTRVSASQVEGEMNARLRSLR